MGYLVEDRLLRPLLNEAVTESSIEVRTGVSIVDHEVVGGGVTARLSDGGSISGRLLVGCDGAK